jgi:long-chain acyl-CoA synthetase
METRPWIAHYDPGVSSQLIYPPGPLFNFLDTSARLYPQKPCTIFQNTSVSYGEMLSLTNRLASALVDVGVAKGDRVGIFLPNLPQFVLAYYAILKVGGIVVAINPQYTPREIVRQVNDAGVLFLFTLADHCSMFRSLLPETTIQTLIVTQVMDLVEQSKSRPFQLASGDYWMLDLLASATSDERPPVPVNDQDMAIFQYTGGTTGVPKGAIGLHRNLVANTLQVRAWLVNVREGEEMVLMAIPLFHVYGMLLGMSLAMALGAGMVMIPNPRDVRDLLVNVQRHRPTIFPGVPTLYNAINLHPDVKNYDLSSIKIAISGSAPLMRETKERFETLTGGKLCEGYGLSEAPTATHCNPILGENRSGSIGLPWPDVDCRIVSLEDGETDLPPGEVGELLVQGPQVMRAYHNMPIETEEALRGGWLHTGDIAHMDADGYFYIVDRKKELIKVGGYQVWPREVEEVIAAHPKVFEVGAAGIPDAFRGEVVKAWVVTKPGETLSVEEVQAWCRESLAPFKIPAAVEFRSELPKTSVGKVLRRELVRQELEKT